MKSQRAVATRYARALFEAARDSGAGDEVGRDLAALHELFLAQAELRQVLARPWIQPEQRQAIARGVAERAGAGKLVQDFVALVAARRRTDHLGEIADVYRSLMDESLGRVRAQVQTAVALEPAERGLLAARLETLLGKQVVIEETVDATLLGGFVTRIGSLVVDGSLDGQLAHVRQRLARG